MFIRKTIAILMITSGIFGLLLLIWEFRVGVWLMAISGEGISYGGLVMLGIISISFIICGVYLLNHNILPSYSLSRNIPRTFSRKIASIIFGIISIWGIIISLQGISIYFNRRGFPIPYEGFRWFNILDLPPLLKETALWASTTGKTTWIVPTLLLVGSIWLFNFSRISIIILSLLNKVRP